MSIQNENELTGKERSYPWLKNEHEIIKIPIIVDILQFDKKCYNKKILKKFMTKTELYKILLLGDRRLARAYKNKKKYEELKLDTHVYFISSGVFAIFIFCMGLLYFAPRHQNGPVLQNIAIILVFFGVLCLLLLEYINIKKPLKEGKTLEDIYYYPLMTFCQEINFQMNDQLFLEFKHIEKSLFLHVNCKKIINDKKKINDLNDSRSSDSDEEKYDDNYQLYEEKENDDENEGQNEKVEGKPHKGKRSFTVINKGNIDTNSISLANKIIGDKNYNKEINNKLNTISESSELDLESESDKERKGESKNLSVPFLTGNYTDSSEKFDKGST